MKPKDSSSLKPFNPTEYAPDYHAPIAALSPPTFPTFPSMEELLAHAAGTQPHPLLRLAETPPPSEPATLFESFLGGELGILTQDVAMHPDRYSDTTRIFLEELAAGAHDLKALPKREAELLSHAVMDFAAARPQKKQLPKKPALDTKKPALLREEGELPDERAAQVELPDGAAVRPYWWA